MKIELKKLKTHEDMSDETLCFSATIYIDGKKAGTVSNHGTGGCNDYHWTDRAAETRLTEYCKTLPKRSFVVGDEKHEYDTDLDSLLDDLITRQDTMKRIKRQMRGVTPFRRDDVSYKPGAYSVLKTTDVKLASEFLTKLYKEAWKLVTAEQILDEICK